jgi:hypothetical protein
MQAAQERSGGGQAGRPQREAEQLALCFKEISA